MAFSCPSCQRTFEEAGFCPFDGAGLRGTASPPDGRAGAAGRGSARDLAAAAARGGGEDRKVTAPLSRSSPARPAPPRETAAASVAIAALSASEDPSVVAHGLGGERADYDRLVGQTLDGRYVVERKLGEGGMGVVFAARHAVIERPLAIKVLKREVMRDAATIKRFVQEAKAASRIGHPGIVDVTDFGTTPDGMTYSVMEYVAGTTLASTIRHGAPLEVPRAFRIAAQIARALGAAHDKGIVHRDLKPDNIFLVDRDGRPDFVKIVDFGIARIIPTEGQAEGPRLTRAGSVFGTPEYMAPEQAAGRSDTDGRVDIYALGIILYEMLTGRVPHKGDSMVRTLAMQMLDPAEPLSRARPDLGFPPQLDELVGRALAKKRDARFQTMGELLAALEAFGREHLPAPVGATVTGSPLYALMPLPPGAEPSQLDTHRAGLAPRVVMSPSQVPAQLHDAAPPPSHAPSHAPGHAPGHIPGARGPSAVVRIHEPEFVATSPPRSFDHVWTDDYTPPPRRRWPRVLFGAMILGGAAGALAVVARSRHAAPPARAEDGGPRDAAAAVPADAAALAEASGDARADPAFDRVLADAATGPVVAEVPGRRDERPPDHPPDHPPDQPGRDRDAGRDAGPRVRDRGGPVTLPEPRGRVRELQVLTRPEGATLYVGTTYRGPGGTTLAEREGTRYRVECRLPGYKPGFVEVTFDGKEDSVVCALERVKTCIQGIKNPFDRCDEAP